jgi:hypothetical protein
VAEGSWPLHGAARFDEVVTVESLAEQSFDHGLAADVEFLGNDVELGKHDGGEIDVDALNRWHHAPELVKKRETLFPWSARRAMDSAETRFVFLRVLFIEFPFLASGFPKRDKMEVFAFGIVPHLENQGVQPGAHPADGAALFWSIGT